MLKPAVSIPPLRVLVVPSPWKPELALRVISSLRVTAALPPV